MRFALFVAGVTLLVVTPNAVGARRNPCTLVGLPSALCGHSGFTPPQADTHSAKRGTARR